MHKNGEQTKWTARILTGLFILLVGLPLIGTFARWDFYPPQAENRALSQRPDLRAFPVVQWPDKITTWFEDHFGFRNTFIRRYNVLCRDWFGRLPSSVLITGKGWLFTTSEGVVSDFMGARVLSPSALQKFREGLEGRQIWMQQKGVGYLWVVPPNKCIIYPEELSAQLQASQGTDGIAQLMAYFDHEGSALHRLDLRKVLLDHKKEGALYFSTDTHWTPLGSYFGYCAVIDAVRPQLPGVGEPVPLTDCRMSSKRWTGDLIPFVGDGKNRDIDYLEIDPPERLLAELETVPGREMPNRPESIVKMLIVRNPHGVGKVVVFHDSFGGSGWQKFFPLHFSETVFLLAARPEKELFEYAIETFHPDLIIEEQVHRMVLYKQQPESPAWTDAFYGRKSSK